MMNSPFRRLVGNPAPAPRGVRPPGTPWWGLLVCAGFCLAAGWLANPPLARSQLRPAATAPAPAASQVNLAAVGALVTQLKQQQAQLADNQGRIETQTAALQEELRLARIYSQRVR